MLGPSTANWTFLPSAPAFLIRNSVCASVEGLENVIERRGGIVERAADQRLRRGGAAPHIDQLDVEALVAEISADAGDLEGRGAQQIAAEGELDRLRRAFHHSARQQRGGARGQRRALQHAAPSHWFRQRRLATDVRKALKAVGFAAVHGYLPKAGIRRMPLELA